MPAPAAILRELHRLRRHAKNLKEEVERLPRLLKGQHAKVAQREEFLKQHQEAIKKLQVHIRDKEGSLKSTHLLIAKHDKQRNEATSKKEYDALHVEITYEKQNCQKFEEEILTKMAEVEEMTAKTAELTKAIQDAKDELTQFEKGNQGRVADLTAELQQTLVGVKEVEAGVPDDIRPVYERQVNARGEDALATLAGRTCTACYTEITAQMYNNLVQGQFVLCKSCGRFLYMSE